MMTTNWYYLAEWMDFLELFDRSLESHIDNEIYDFDSKSPIKDNDLVTQFTSPL